MTTITVTIPPLWDDKRIAAYAAQAGNPRQAAAMRSAALRVRHDYEAEIGRLREENNALRAQLQELSRLE